MNKFTISKSFAISAGAGSGKTYTLSRRYINAFLGFDLFGEELAKFEDIEINRAEIDEIVTITYTNAAALEMKERIFSLMKKIINEDKEVLKDLEKLNEKEKKYVKERLEYGLTKINEAKISTIHSFAFDLVKENSDLLGLPLELEVVDALEQNRFFEESYFEVLNKNSDLVKSFYESFSLFHLKKLAKKYVFDKKFREYFDKFKNDLKYFKDLHKSFGDIIDNEIVEKANKEINGLKKWYEDLINYSSKLNFKEFVENQIGEALNYRKKLHKEKYPNVRVFKDLLNEDDFSFNNEKEQQFEDIVEKLKELLEKIYEKYSNKLKENNLLDFDLIVDEFKKLVEKKEIRFKYIMIDEFQDTNSLQYEIINSIKKDNFFIVGDEKQSIYAFQGAEIEVFKKAKKEIKKVEPLEDNYRSDKKIIDFVNEKFENMFKNEFPIDNDFAATFEKLKAKSKKEGSVKVLKTFYKQNRVEEEAENIALLIKEILEGKQYKDIKENYIDKNKLAIGVLYDTKTHMEVLKNKLNILGIDCKVVGGDTFWEKDEIKDVISILFALKTNKKFYKARALEAIGFSDKKVVENINEDIKNFFDFECEEMHTCIRKIYLKLHKKYDIQAKANIEELIRIVINLSKKENYNEKVVLKTLEENFFNATKENAIYNSDTSNIIELCSIHHTKGLDYPMIILTDINKNLLTQKDNLFYFEKFSVNGKEKFAFGFKIKEYAPLARRVASKVQDLKMLEEKKRLLYVALTRPKHHIVLSVVNKEGKESIADNSYLEFLNGLEDLEEVTLSSSFESKELKKEVELEIYEKIDYERKNEFFSEEAILGECVHKILEVCWEKRKNSKKIKRIIRQFGLTEKEKEILKMFENFKKSNVYKELKEADEKYFELPYVDEENGRIDLVYRLGDEWKIVDFKTGKKKDYSDQLKKYEDILRKNGFKNISSSILYLGDSK